jgi:RES domain-containing protein
MLGVGSNDNIPVTRMSCRTYRLINSRHPTVGVFDRVANRDQAIAAILIEQLTNSRNTGIAERLAKIPEKECIFGQPGATLIMGAFVHTSEEGGRFNTEVIGAWYASLVLETAIRETVYHQYCRLRKSRMNLHGTVIQLRELITQVNAEFHDLRNAVRSMPALYDRDDYAPAQQFAEGLRKASSNGICYKSVRHENGDNLAVFKPSLLPPVHQGDHYQYEWYNDPEPVVRKLTNIV